jgi:hypothetical protein
MVPDVEAYWQVVQQMEVPVLWPLENRAYGLRDFTIVRPDGVGLCCATHLTDLPGVAQKHPMLV